MLKKCYLLILIFGLIGCSSKVEKDFMKEWNSNLASYQNLQKTQKLQFYEENLTKMMMSVTYLESINEEKNNNEKFIINILTEEETPFDGLNLKYYFSLNGKKAIRSKKIDKEEIILKNISFLTPWGSYYLIEFQGTTSKKLLLSFNAKRYGKGTMYFAKVAKYILEE